MAFERDPPRPGVRRIAWARTSASWLASAVAHGLALALLALVVLPAILREAPTPLEASLEQPTDTTVDPLTPFASSDLQAGSGRGPAAEAASVTIHAETTELAALAPTLDTETGLTSDVAPTTLPAADQLGYEYRPWTPRQPGSSAPAVGQAESVDGALAGVLAQIEAGLAESDLLVVWLFDASISLRDDLARVRAELEPFFNKLGQRNQRNGRQLFTAAVAFGRDVSGLQERTLFGGRLVDQLAKLQHDPTGSENVLWAVNRCIDRYCRATDGSTLFVIWTDESGDDAHDPSLLEAVIQQCRADRVAVTVVGPSAVLGRHEGTHAYLHTDGRVYQLPVRRGPDSFHALRPRLPYLWPTKHEGRRMLPPWFGGPDLAALASGMSPYGLTRLTMETGGSYTIFDRPTDRGPFDTERLEDYLPEYDSAAEIQARVAQSPLRQALLASAANSWAAEFNGVAAPEFASPHTSGAGDSLLSRNVYVAPADFRRLLELEIKNQPRKARAMLALVEASLAPLQADGVETSYSSEPACWRAWYDLNLGRLLAMRVRLQEYIYFWENDAPNAQMDPLDNRLELSADRQLRIVDPQHQAHAREAESRLKFCAKEHDGTPWAHLAERELADPFGVQLKTWAVARPPPVPIRPAPPVKVDPLPKL